MRKVELPALDGTAVCLCLFLCNALGQLLRRGIIHAHTLGGILDRLGPLLLRGDLPAVIGLDRLKRCDLRHKVHAPARPGLTHGVHSSFKFLLSQDQIDRVRAARLQT